VLHQKFSGSMETASPSRLGSNQLIKRILQDAGIDPGTIVRDTAQELRLPFFKVNTDGSAG